jgi:acyl-CoA synthetase (AMP-forming)/AMP-acid ligase II
MMTGFDDGVELRSRIDAILAIDPTAPAMEFEGRWHTWGELAHMAQTFRCLLDESGVGPGCPVGVLLRNRPTAVGLLLAIIQAGACAVAINPAKPDRACADLRSLGLPFVVGEKSDVAAMEGCDPGATLIAAEDLGAPHIVRRGEQRVIRSHPGVAVKMLTSGTTGPPKRIDLTTVTLSRALLGAKHYEAQTREKPELRDGVAVVNSPLVHLGGLFRILQCVADGRRFVLLERFSVDSWSEAVRTYRPRTVSLVPTALRMVLESDIDPEVLSSVKSVVSGTAPLSPDDAETFTARFGVPVLVAYAATEFGGGVAGWNLADYRQFASSKRGSVGRAHSDCELRVVTPEGETLPPGEEGLLEVKAGQLGSESGWIRTTDLARLDEDGFLWILGRSDETIIRGGFKVQPEEVRVAIESHPAVAGAVVIGVPDRRLGAVPVAVVELRAQAPSVSAEDVLSHVEQQLARYELPVEVRFVESLPRTPVGKPDLQAVRSIFEGQRR